MTNILGQIPRVFVAWWRRALVLSLCSSSGRERPLRAPPTCSLHHSQLRCNRPHGAPPPKTHKNHHEQNIPHIPVWHNTRWCKRTAAHPPSNTPATRTGESPRSVRPNPASPRTKHTWRLCHRFRAENTVRGPWTTEMNVTRFCRVTISLCKCVCELPVDGIYQSLWAHWNQEF